MKEAFEKIKERLEAEVEYQSSKADQAGKTCAFEEITVVKAREKMAECYEHAIEIVNQVAEEYSNSEIPNMSEKVTGSDAPDTNVGNKDDCCEWVMCDEDENVYNTACGNSEMLFDGSPIDNNYSFCPYCGKKIKLLECTNCKWYWQNNDTENECSGSATTCVEYSEIAPYQPKGE